MKKVYIVILWVGLILMGATESEYGVSNLVGLLMFTLSGYKIGLFDEPDREQGHINE